MMIFDYYARGQSVLNYRNFISTFFDSSIDLTQKNANLTDYSSGFGN